MKDLEKIRSKLEKMKGKTWMHNTRHYKIIDYVTYDGKSIIINTDVHNITLKDRILERLEKEFLPVEDDTAIVVHGQNIIPEPENLQKIIMDNIKRVQTDSNYIKQANTINSSVNTLLSMAKTQLEVLKYRKKN